MVKVLHFNSCILVDLPHPQIWDLFSVFTVTLTVFSDRPLKLQTSDFGEQWQRQTHDCKLDADVSPAVTMSKVMTLMTHELNLHLVEIIGE